MDLDLTGGLSERREYGFAEYPHTPDMRDSVNFWFCDDQGRFGMPRCVMEATGPNWQDDREATVNVGSLPADLPVPDVALRLRCSVCGSKRVTTRPDLSKMYASWYSTPRNETVHDTPI